MWKLYENKAACFGCAACAARCPEGAVGMERDAEGFSYPVINGEKCVDCGACDTVCPGKNPLGKSAFRAYAVRIHDEKALYESTSGGAFTLLANAVLRNGGTVAGAVYDRDFRVVSCLSEDIAPMRKSKYIQCDPGESFREIACALGEGKQVLFTGTPCQCHAMKLAFPDEKGLLLAALICRGVMAPGLWEEYTGYLAGEGKLTAFSFRDKRRLDDAHTVAWSVDGEEKTASFMQDPFCRIYAKELAFRPSCYACPYTVPDKAFDFTMGDFWGVEKVLPRFADGKGVSLLYAAGERAERIVEMIRSESGVVEVPPEETLQPALRAPAKEAMLRRFFLKDFAAKGPDGRCDMPRLLKKYGF